MIGFEVLRPGWLWLPLLVLVLQLVGLWGQRVARRRAAVLVDERQRERFAPGASRTRSGLRLALASAALFLVGLSALGPVRGYTTRPTVRRGLDLVVCLDTSRSMLAEDLRPNRLERAKREVRGLLDALSGDRVGIVAFSGDARDVAPLTHDRTTLDALLDYVSPADNLRGGTDLAAALQHALDLFDGRTGSHEAIVLLTDGEDLEGRAEALAAQAGERGIRVFLVGIGTEAGAKIRVTAANGSEAFLLDPNGEEVVTKLEGTSLQRIAEATGGAYLSTEMSPTPLEDLYAARIATLEGREFEGGERRIPHDRYQWSLALAVLCMLIEIGLREGKRVGRSSSERAAGAGRGRADRRAARSKRVASASRDETPVGVAALAPLALLPLVQSGAPAGPVATTPVPGDAVQGDAAQGDATQGDATQGEDAGFGDPGEPEELPPLPDFDPLFVDFRAAVDAGNHGEASLLALPYLDPRRTEPDAEPEGERFEHQLAALRFGLGLARADAEEPEIRPAAVQDFYGATALAGPGELRLRAMYDAGVVELQEGERQRASLPEVSGQAPAGPGGSGMQGMGLPPLPGGPTGGPTGAPGAPGAPGATGATGAPEGPGPLELARAAYQRARTALTERLRADWRDVDTRANLELIQRRLKELDDIERQREEQQQQQQDQNQDGDPSDEDSENQENRENEREQDEPDPSSEDEEGEDAEQNPEDQQQDGEEEPSEENQDPQDQEDSEQQEGEEQSADQQPLEAPEETPGEPQPAEPTDAERHLTKEEVMRLLDQIEAIDEQARAAEARMRGARRKPVDRDW